MSKVFPKAKSISRRTARGRFMINLLTRFAWLQEVKWWHVGVGVLALGLAGGVLWKVLATPPKLSSRVVATVDGAPITQVDLSLEAQGDDNIAGPARRQLIDAIVDRKLLAAAARKAGLGSEPQVAASGPRAIEALLAGALAQRLAGEERIDDAAARQYVASHPWKFAARQVMVIDGGPLEQSVANGSLLDKANTIDDAATILKRANLPFVRSKRVIDSSSLPDELAKQLAAAPEGQLFVVPLGSMAMAGAVNSRGNLVAPEAVQIEQARAAVAAERREAKVRAALAKMRKQAKISYTN